MEVTIRKINELRGIAREHKDVFYYEALGQIKEFIVVENYQNLYKLCKN